MTRGLRNNNPLNIRRGNTCWQGMTKEQNDKSFVQFKSMAYGYRAVWRTLNTYFYRFLMQKKPFCVETIIHRWAPPVENDTKAYISTVTSLTGIGETEKLPAPDKVHSYPQLSNLISAMTVMENGIPMSEVDRDAILEGYRLAFPDNRWALTDFLLDMDEYKDW